MFNITVGTLRKILIPVTFISIGLVLTHQVIHLTEAYVDIYDYYDEDLQECIYPWLQILVPILLEFLFSCTIIGLFTQGFLLCAKGNEGEFKCPIFYHFVEILLWLIIGLLGLVGIYLLLQLVSFIVTESNFLLRLKLADLWPRLCREDSFDLLKDFLTPSALPLWFEGYPILSLPLNILMVCFSFILLPITNLLLFYRRFCDCDEQEECAPENPKELEQAVDTTADEASLPTSTPAPEASPLSSETKHYRLKSVETKKYRINKPIEAHEDAFARSTHTPPATTSPTPHPISLAHIFSLEGRARRLEYWGVGGVAFLLSALGGLLSFAAMSISLDLGFLLFSIVAIISFIVILPTTVRRYHDLNMSGFYILVFLGLSFIPYIGFISGIVCCILLGFIDGTPGPNTYGPCPKGRGTPIKKTITSPTHVIELHLQRIENLYAKKIITTAKYESQKALLLEKLKKIQEDLSTKLMHMTQQHEEDKAKLQEKCNAIKSKIHSVETQTSSLPKTTSEERLLKLKSLYEKEIISEEEYTAQRKQILTEI